MNRASRHLAALARERQEQITRRADRAAALMDRAILQVWRELLGLLRRQPVWSLAHGQVRSVFSLLPRLLAQTLAAHLERLAGWSWQSTAAGVVEAVPVRALEAAASQKARRGHGSAGLPVPGAGVAELVQLRVNAYQV